MFWNIVAMTLMCMPSVPKLFSTRRGGWVNCCSCIRCRFRDDTTSLMSEYCCKQQTQTSEAYILFEGDDSISRTASKSQLLFKTTYIKSVFFMLVNGGLKIYGLFSVKSQKPDNGSGQNLQKINYARSFYMNNTQSFQISIILLQKEEEEEEENKNYSAPKHRTHTLGNTSAVLHTIHRNSKQLKS